MVIIEDWLSLEDYGKSVVLWVYLCNMVIVVRIVVELLL